MFVYNLYMLLYQLLLHGRGNLDCLGDSKLLCVKGSWEKLPLPPPLDRSYIYTYHHTYAQHCIIVVCGNPPRPSNGRVSAPSTYVGDNAYYYCDYGYHLSGSSPRVCQSSRSWSGIQPSCIREYMHEATL